jgi:hypothetical protein
MRDDYGTPAARYEAFRATVTIPRNGTWDDVLTQHSPKEKPTPKIKQGFHKGERRSYRRRHKV